ncbi:hypothetical protein BH11ACT4_BH11ACT4_23700 [soil metagenome]
MAVNRTRAVTIPRDRSVYPRYTRGVTATTIKVPSELRDRLNAEARRTGGTVAGVIERLFAESERVERFRQIRLARGRMTADDRASYDEETALWDRASDEDLTAPDPQ